MLSPRPQRHSQQLPVTTRLFHLHPTPTFQIILKHFTNILLEL